MPSAAHGAVFLSYASQDLEAVRRIAAALSGAGIEVWFDVNELVGGDAWDAKIKSQVKECALFMPVISAATQSRTEGYFRLEWRMADQRTHLMAKGRPFLVPVVIDATRDSEALVPDSFFEVQWTRLPNGETAQGFAEHVKGLLHGSPVASRPVPAAAESSAIRPPLRRSPLPYAIAGVALAALGAGAYLHFRPSPSAAETPVPPAAPLPVAVASAQPLSEARQLAKRAFAMSVDQYDSRLDDYTAAESLVKHALDLDKDDGEIWAISADINVMFYNRGFDFSPERLNTAHQQAERAIRLVPDSVEANYVAAFLATRYGDPQHNDGRQKMEHVIQLDPNHARALLSLGSTFFREGLDAEGSSFYERVSQQPKWAPLVQYYWFLHYFGYAHFAEADASIRRSISLGAAANTQGCLAMLHLTWKGDLDEAARELEAIPTSMQSDARVVYFAAKIELARRRPEAALAILDRLPDNFIHDSWFIGPKDDLVGMAHRIAGRPEAARLAWESGLAVVEARLKLRPNDVDLHRARGVELGWLGRESEALDEAKTVDELYRHVTGEWDRSVIQIYAAMGRADLVVPMLQPLVVRKPIPENQKLIVTWSLTPTLLRLDPIWDRVRSAPGFAELTKD